MKKFLLLFAAVLLTVGASAGNRVKRLPALQKKSYSMNLGAFNSVSSKMQAGHPFDANIQTKKVLKAPAKGKTLDVELNPAYSMEIYYLIGGAGFVTESLYDGASFLIDGSNAYFAPFAELDYLEGQVESGRCYLQELYSANGYDYKIDSITFTAGKVIGRDSNGNQYVALVGDYDSKTGEVGRADVTTFGGYYFPDFNEMMVPEIIGLFDKEGTSSAPIAGYCYANFELESQEDYKDYFFKGTFKTKDSFDEGEDVGKEYTGDVVILYAYDGLYIKGFDLYSGLYGNFVKFAFPEDETIESGYDNSSAVVDDYQHLATVYGKDGTAYDLVTLGVNTAFDDYATPGFFVLDNEDETISIESDGMALLLGYCPGKGSFEALQDLSITMTSEKYDYDASVKPATVQDVSTAYFDLLGRKVNAAQKGLLIKKSTMADGSVQSVKVLNK